MSTSKSLDAYIKKAKSIYELKELERLGLTPDMAQREMILNFMALLLKWNDVAGLVSKKDAENLFIRHVCDSLQPLLLFGFKKNALMLDLGSGGGFPAIPTRIFRPDISTVLVESNKKKAAFLQEVKRVLALDNVEIFSGRLERMTTPETRFDYVVCRGIGTLREFATLAKAFVAPDGRMYTFKGREFSDEVEEITNFKEKEGIRICEIAEYDLGNEIFGLKLVSLEAAA
jgi:16S rRNA (guanine527-N7)-methyltransferase